MQTLGPILNSAVVIMTPLLLAATGGLFTELSGMLNIALEGLMLIGAFGAIVFTHYSGSMFIGILAGILCSMLLASLIATVSLYLKANVFITGLAANLLVSGLTVVLSFKLFGNKGVVSFVNIPQLPLLHLRWIEKIPVIGNLLMGHNGFVYFSWLLLLLCNFVLYRTPFGLRLQASGLHDQVLVSLGLRPAHYRFIAFLVSGFTCALSGAQLTLNLGAYVPNITAGKGWIALVVIFLGQKRPFGLLVAACIFGLADAFSNFAQGSWDIPADFILAIPYILTLVAIIGVSIYTKRKSRIG